MGPGSMIFAMGVGGRKYHPAILPAGETSREKFVQQVYFTRGYANAIPTTNTGTAHAN